VLDLVEVRLSRAITSAVSPPWKALATKAPPGLSTSMAKSAPISIRPTMRRWSVSRWPTVLGAMSDSTTSGAPPSSSSSLGGQAGIGEVHLQDVSRRNRIDGQQVDADEVGHPALDGHL
jgi:hypothetical protein